MGSATTEGSQGKQVLDVDIADLTRFLPKQEQAFQAVMDKRFVLYGGARGPGKSYWLRWSLFALHASWMKHFAITNVTTGLFCDTYPELRDRQITKIKQEFPIGLGEIKSTQEEGLGFHIRPEWGGGMIALRNLDDPSKYKSAEFAAVGIDELTRLMVPDLDEENTFDILRGSLRWPGIKSTKFLAATNPGDVGHAWVKKLWIDRNFPSRLANLDAEFEFIKALPKDNPYLGEEYWNDLNSLPEPLYKAWVEGNWDVFAGMAFPGWNRDVHVEQARELPSWWTRWRCVDWGFHSPFACYWLAKDPDIGRIYVYRELYAKGLSDKQQARAIADNTSVDENVQLTFADPSMWAKRKMEEIATSSADIYAANGVPLTRGDNDRESGKRKVDRLLMRLPDGGPGIVIFDNCVNLIRTLPALPYDKLRTEDVDSDAEDHAYDALRYGLTSIYEPTKQKAEFQTYVRRPKGNLRSVNNLL